MTRHAEPFDDGGTSASGRGAEPSVPRPTPLTLVAGAVAGNDLASIAITVADVLACPVAIAIPALGGPVVGPAGAIDAPLALSIAVHAREIVDRSGGAPLSGGSADRVPDRIADLVPVRIADQVVGIIVAIGVDHEADGMPVASSDRRGGGDRRAWLEAAAAAASVTALIREPHTVAPSAPAGADLLAELAAGQPADLPAFLSRARRAGAELSAGAIAISARHPAAELTGAARFAPSSPLAQVLLASRGPGRLLALAALATDGQVAPVEALISQLHSQGWTTAASTPRRDPAQLHHAVLEAELLGELHGGDGAPTGQDDTFRLLIGVLLRDPGELEGLCQGTVLPLSDYDARHDTDLLATLRAFLTHDGSTTETAEAMQLHRHTVGYRLTRVHEVSGLSPYASDGRERLSLGIKALQILDADTRRRQLH